MTTLNDGRLGELSNRNNRASGKTRTSRAGAARGLILLLGVAGAMMAVLAGGYRERPARAAATPQTPVLSPTPDYSNVNDILNGRRELLRTDDLAISSLTGNYYLNSNDSNLTNAGGDSASFSRTVINSGRMFNLPYDITVTVAEPTNGPALELYMRHPGRAETKKVILFGELNPVSPYSQAMGDFNRDGYSDLALHYSDSAGRKMTRVITAGDVNNYDADLKFGPEFQDPDYQSGNSWDSGPIAVGDFNGDGQPEIARSGLGASFANVELAVYSVNPQTLSISKAAQITLNIPEAGNFVVYRSMGAGRFTAANHDQLIIAYGTQGDTAKVKVIDFDPATLQPQEKSTWDTGGVIGSHNDVNNYLTIRTGRLNWSGRYDQAVLMLNAGAGNTLSTLLIDPADLTIKRQGKVTLPSAGCLSDMVLGNFDRRDPDPQNPQQKNRNPNLQAAVLGNNNCSSNPVVTVYNIDPQTLALTEASTYNFSTAASPRIRFASGDLQGRSIVLGEPTKVVIDGTAQPTVVAAAPPMHVDFMPAAGETRPKVLNLSVAPDGFYTTYETEDTSSNQSSTTDTTSWSFGAKESFSGSYTLGNVDSSDLELGGGIRVEDTLKAAQDLKGSTEGTHGTYSTHTFNIAQQTGFVDQLWYSQTRYNIYVYPVIGKTVCPATKPNCQDSEKVPLTIQFSGPDQTSYETIAGSQIEWYQPPWEYGNILSYPASYAQLQQIVPGINKLSNDLTWFTDASDLTIKTTWATGTTDATTTSFDQNYSFENDLSVTAKATSMVASIDFKGELDLSGSYGLNHLHKSSTDLGKSTGIGVHKPGTFATPEDYGYFVTPYIFGQKKPGGVVDNIPLSGDVQTFGLLRTAFVVDPMRNNAGGWWKQAYTTHPDVAVNHPSRWAISPAPLAHPVPSNCLQASEASMNCAALAPSRPDNPWVSEFHHMRGFFISNASHPGQGPQLETAQAGDKLALQTRVYNYSLAPMAPDAKVHVRFYGMPWNNSNNSSAGDSFLIGEEVLSPIPPFSTDNKAPLNWVTASTTFDTTGYQNKYLVFWVVVWMQTSDGKLGAEIADHGMTGLPGTLKSLKDVSSLEEEYGNNVGFYKMPFYVFTPSSAEAEPVLEHSPADVRLGLVRVSRHRIEVGQAVEVSALLRTRANTASGVSVVFYDGDPAEGGKAFDVERIPHLRARDAHEVRVTFRPKECGEYRVFVTVGKGKPFEATDSSLPVRVKCADAPPACTDALCFRSPEYYRRNASGGLPPGRVWIAGLPAPVSTRHVWAVVRALGGGDSAIRHFNQQHVAAQLTLLAANGANRAALSSRLSCYGLNFTPLQLSNGASLAPASTLKELFAAAEWAARDGRAGDWQELAGVLGQLVGDGPAGGCLVGEEPAMLGRK